MKRIAVVGGGFSGAAAAVQLARRAQTPIEIVIVEPRPELGRGVAYSTLDPDHRLNGPLDNHLIDPGAPEALRRWCQDAGVLARDPEAIAANGGAYIRRGDFGAHVSATVRALGPAIRHHRARALALAPLGDGEELLLDDGSRLGSDLVILATGNGAVQLPAALSSLAGHAALAADPFAAPILPSIPPDGRVLVVGSGLTALDVVSTLVRRGHAGPVTVLSRHGLRPHAQPQRAGDADVVALLAKIEGPAPPYAAGCRSVRELLRVTRARIREREGLDPSWHAAFSEVRDSVWRLWPALPLAEKQRFLRHLRRWYDVFRFRAPPQNEVLARAAEVSGAVRFMRGRIEVARPAGVRAHIEWMDPAGRRHGGEFDAVFNCSGLDPSCGAGDNPLLASLLRQGRIRRDDTGFGFAVDANCRPFDAHGVAQARLRVIGPPSAGTFGDPLGVIFIAAQILRTLPGVLRQLGIEGANGAIRIMR